MERKNRLKRNIEKERKNKKIKAIRDLLSRFNEKERKERKIMTEKE